MTTGVLRRRNLMILLLAKSVLSLNWTISVRLTTLLLSSVCILVCCGLGREFVSVLLTVCVLGLSR